MERDPCPWRMVDDTGGGFGIGLVGGTIWHFFGGLRNAPKGHRLSQAITRVQVRVPHTAGAFAVWGTLFSCFDCAITSIRKKEDPLNAIMSGACTGGFLAARAGLKSMGLNAAMGGVILAAMEGIGIAFQRIVLPWIEKKYAQPGQIDLLEPPVDPRRRQVYKPQPILSLTNSPPPVGTEETWKGSRSVEQQKNSWFKFW